MGSGSLIIVPEGKVKWLLHDLAMSYRCNMLFGLNAEWLTHLFPSIQQTYELTAEIKIGGEPEIGEKAVTVGEGLLWCIEYGIPGLPLYFPGSQYKAEGQESEHYLFSSKVDFNRLFPALINDRGLITLCAGNWVVKESHGIEPYQLIAIRRIIK